MNILTIDNHSFSGFRKVFGGAGILPVRVYWLKTGAAIPFHYFRAEPKADE